jgi:hypothetical protein
MSNNPNPGTRSVCAQLQPAVITDQTSVSAKLDSGEELTRYEKAKKIDELISRDDFLALGQHLHNENGAHDFVMGMTDKNGNRDYQKSKRQHLMPALTGSWTSITEQSEYPFTTAIYAKNLQGSSVWACIDVDAHNDIQKPAAERVVKKLYPVLEEYVRSENATNRKAVLIEDSGRGYHIWFIGKVMQPVSEWSRFLKSLLGEADLKPSEENMELFPLPSNLNLGKPVRMPGSANINTWHVTHGTYECSKIIAQVGIFDLVSHLRSIFPILDGENKRDLPFVLKDDSEQGRSKQAAPVPLLELKDAKRVLSVSAIDYPSTRHNQLCTLVGQGFHHFSRKQLRILAAHQYSAASCPPSSTMEEHMSDFSKIYEGRKTSQESRFSEEEREIYSQLKNGGEKESFIIAQNFARLAMAKKQHGKDARFPFSGLHLASRLGATTPTAYRHRKTLIQKGVLKLVATYKAKVSANMFVYLLKLRDE